MTIKRKIFFYKKNRRDFIPVEDADQNKVAEQRLKEIFKSDDVPEWIRGKWDDVYLLQNNGDISKAKSLYIKSLDTGYDLSNKLNELTSKEWLTETVTVFSQKGLGASNKNAQIEKQHPAPFSFQDVARLMKFYTKENHIVLDPFSGVGSTNKACAFENRVGYGIELNKKYHDLATERIKIEVPDSSKLKSHQVFINSDALKEIKKIKKDFFDFIITSPPLLEYIRNNRS
ncbi:DNA methyltransferase [Bacteroidota bacterium]